MREERRRRERRWACGDDGHARRRGDNGGGWRGGGWGGGGDGRGGRGGGGGLSGSRQSCLRGLGKLRASIKRCGLSDEELAVLGAAVAGNGCGAGGLRAAVPQPVRCAARLFGELSTTILCLFLQPCMHLDQRRLGPWRASPSHTLATRPWCVPIQAPAASKCRGCGEGQ